MNEGYKAGMKIILKNMNDDEIPEVPKNRQQRRAAKKVRGK